MVCKTTYWQYYAWIVTLSEIRSVLVDACFVSRPQLKHDVILFRCIHPVDANDIHFGLQCSSAIRMTELAARKSDTSNANSGEEDTIFYNDDAFGLIFLSASLVLRDFPFAAAFLLLSGATSAAISAKAFKFQPVLPGVVAFAALTLGKFEPLSTAAQTFGGDFALPLDENGRKFELAICFISLVWGIIQQGRSSDKN